VYRGGGGGEKYAVKETHSADGSNADPIIVTSFFLIISVINQHLLKLFHTFLA
jgi:hypothetical protein